MMAKANHPWALGSRLNFRSSKCAEPKAKASDASTVELSRKNAPLREKRGVFVYLRIYSQVFITLRAMKRFLLPLVALCLLAPNVCSQDEKKAPETVSYSMADGLQVQINNVGSLRDDTSAMLGIWFWKFRFSMPKKGQSVRLSWELRTPGKEPRQFSEIGTGPVPKVDYIYGLQPVDGDKIDSSPKIRMYNRQSQFDGEVEDKGLGRYEIRDNPFLGLGSRSIPYDPPVRPDNSILMMRFSPSGKNDDPKNSELVVVVTLQDPPPAK